MSFEDERREFRGAMLVLLIIVIYIISIATVLKAGWEILTL